VITLPESADLDTTAELAQRMAGEIDAEVEGTQGLVQVDARALAQFDTSAIALLLHLRRRAEARQRGFELLNPPDKLAQLARLYGVAELLGLPGNGAVPASSAGPAASSKAPAAGA
jgi:phospholipid transport system transporter-binding protein